MFDSSFHYIQGLITIGNSFIMFLYFMMGITRKNRIGTAFSLFVFCFVIWFAGLGWNYFTVTDPIHDFWSRWFYFGICFIPTTFYYFTIVYLKLSNRIHAVFLFILFAISLIFSILAQFHKEFITGAEYYSRSITATYGIIGNAFIVFMIFSIVGCLLIWFVKCRNEKEVAHRQRLQIIFVSFLICSLSLIDFLPVLGVSMYSFGYIFATASLGFQTYAIFVYHLSTIHNFLYVFSKYTITLCLLSIPWILLYYLSLPFKVYLSWQHSWFLALLAFVLYVPYIRYGMPWVSAIIFKKDNEYQKIIQMFFDDIVTLKKPDELVQSIQSLLLKTLDTKRVVIVTKKIDRGKYYFWSDNSVPTEMPQNLDLLIPWFVHRPLILIKYDLAYDPQYQLIRESALSLLNYFNSELVIPIVQANNLLGLILLGSISANSFYKSIDLRFLVQLQPFVNVAMNNSALYEHIRYLSVDLLEVNEKLNDKVKQRSRELEEALTHMRKLNEEQNNFFNLASHHLRTPLTSVKAASTLLWARYPNDKLSGINSILMDNIRRLETLIKNIIEIAKMENDRMDLRPSKINIHKLILKSYLEIEALYPEKQLECSFHLDDSIQTVQADASRLKTVFSNLFSNAFRFTPKGGGIKVRLSSLSRSQVSKYELSEASLTDMYYEFSVSDTGEGIPDKEKHLIFDIFHQVRESHKRYQGPGLGLYLVKKIIENHHGGVTLESELQKGSTFSFVIPVL